MKTLAMEAFATGRRGQVLKLQVFPSGGYLWAGLYDSPLSRTPVELSVGTRRTVITRPRELHLGEGRYAMSPKALQRALRWLDRQGVHIREDTP